MPLTTESSFLDTLDYKHNTEPKCPHCDSDIGISAHDLYDLYEDGEHEIECPYCETPIKVISECTYHFSTTFVTNEDT